MTLIIVIIIISVIFYTISKQKSAASGSSRTNKGMWQQTASALNLNLFPPTEDDIFPSMAGMVDGVSTEIWGDFDENGFGLIFCRVDYARELPFKLCIVKGDFESKPAGTVFEIRGVSSPEVSVTASNRTELQKFLTTQNINILKNCTGIYHSAKITESFMILGGVGINDSTTFISFIERTVSAAKTLSGGHTITMQPSDLPKISPVEDSREIYIPSPEPVPEKNIMPTTIPVPEEAPAPEIIKPKQEIVPEPVIPAVPSVSEFKPEPVSLQSEPGSEIDLSAEGFSKALFSASFPGEKEKSLFKQHAGKTVQWSGVLKSVYPYSSDFVFGKGPGVKATFEICEVASGYGMKQKVKATVSFGEESMEILKGKTGETFTFSGTLLKMELFAREILLEKGSLQG